MIKAIDRPLTDKQRSFVEHYCTDAAYNASKAYLLAGYSKIGADGNSCRMIVKDSIKGAIAKYMAENKLKTELTRDLQTQRITKQYDKADAAGDTRAALAALDQLNRRVGYYEEDNAQKQPQTANIAIIESEAALDKLELELIQKQKALGNAICEG